MELHPWALVAILDAADEEVGSERVNELFRGWNIDVRSLLHEQAWTKFEFGERFMQGMVELVGPEIIERAGRAAISNRYLGPIYPLLRAFGSVGSTIDGIVKSAPRFNKARDIRIEQTGPRKRRIFLELSEGLEPPKTKHVCTFVRAQLEAVPLLFGGRLATVHETCMCDGHDLCTFEVEWDESSKRMKTWVAFPLVFATVAALAMALSMGSTVSLLFASLAATSAYFMLETWRQSKEIEELVARTNTFRASLTTSARQNEERFEALVDAKARVDEKVDVRTSDLAATTARLHKTLTELRSLNQARVDFFSNISHELRTPLTLLLSPIEQLARGEEPAGGHDVAVVAMERNARRLITMIDQLLDLARAESASATLTRSAVEPASLVRALEESFSAAANAKSVTLNFDASRAPSIVGIDRAWIETAVTNLLANGLRYSSAGDELALRVVDNGDELVFEVSDEGPGIAEELRARLFERFSRGVGATAGSGIGLALVAEAARLHDGRVEVDSEVGVGATFRLYVPRVLVERESTVHSFAPMSIQNVDADTEERRAGPDEAAPLALVVEDNSDVRRFVCDVLAVRYRVESATDGKQGLKKAEALVPDVIVSDVSMPTMNGLELTRAVRESPALRDIPIVLVTARSEADQVLDGFDAGAEDYVAKPFHGRELLARVDALVRARRMVGRFTHRERLATLGFTAASVAHNIRNPLNSLIAGLPVVEARLADGMDAPTKKMFAVFRECADRIEAVTTDLLDLSRVDRDAVGTYCPGRGLAACARLMESRFSDSISIELSVDKDAHLRGRAGDMHSVFLNLLDNAARAVGDDGTVRITGGLIEGHYEILVEDTGPGVPELLRQRIFEPFVTTRQPTDGTGLGLAIARDVVTQQGGTITVGQSGLGGAEFRIRIPLAS
ncbi:MAG: ATP-binding protein [Polyangiales bacterium]